MPKNRFPLRSWAGRLTSWAGRLTKHIVLPCFVATLLGVQFAPIVLGQETSLKFIFEDRHTPVPVKGIPGDFAGKPWSQAEKTEVLDLLAKTGKVAGGFMRRVTFYRPLRLYRTQKGGAPGARVAFSYGETNAVVFRDGFFRWGPTARLYTLIHEMVHISDIGRRISRSEQWATLVRPRIDRIRVEFAALKKSSKVVPELRARNQLARAHGLPSFYASTTEGEALADVVSYHVLIPSYTAPPAIERFIGVQMLQAPRRHEVAVEAYHACGEAMDRRAYDGAIKACGAAIKADPEFGGAYYRRSYLWRQVNDLDKAIDDLTQAIERAHGDLHLMYLYRALAWFDKRKCAAFSLDMARAVSYKPDFTHPYLYGEYCKVGRGDHRGAVEEFSRAIQLTPKWAHLYVSRGEVLQQTKRCDRAIADYSTAIKLAPGATKPHALRAACRKKLKDYKGAVADYTTLIKVSPKEKKYYMARAMTYGAMGLVDKAVADFEQVKRIQPDMAALIDSIIRGLKVRKKRTQ